VLSSIAGELGGRAEYCRDGQRWAWDGVSFEILHPPRARPPPHNNASCVLRIRSAHGSVLLTGDVEEDAEETLLAGEGRLRSDVLLVPHQGSITSSTPDFIDRVDPSRAVVAAGYRNRYGHPHPCVVARYRARGIPFLNTAWHGAVIVRFTREGISMKGWRQLQPRYWLDDGAVAHADATIC
jgi:competence protein ComEC